MKVYVGVRDQDGTAHVFVEADGQPRRRLDHIILHSPTGLEWGYGGSGPADCALSILADFLGEAPLLPAIVKRQFSHRHMPVIAGTKAWRLHQAFKYDVIARLGHDVPVGRPYVEGPVRDLLTMVEEWRLTEAEVTASVERILDARGDEH